MHMHILQDCIKYVNNVYNSYMNNKISEINRKIGIRIKVARFDKKISQNIIK